MMNAGNIAKSLMSKGIRSFDAYTIQDLATQVVENGFKAATWRQWYERGSLEFADFGRTVERLKIDGYVEEWEQKYLPTFRIFISIDVNLAEQFLLVMAPRLDEHFTVHIMKNGEVFDIAIVINDKTEIPVELPDGFVQHRGDKGTVVWVTISEVQSIESLVEDLKSAGIEFVYNPKFNLNQYL
jgi:hypothetical protein